MVIIRIKKELPSLKIDVELKFGAEICVLEGPNGSGKTTILRTIAGLDKVGTNESFMTVMGHVFSDCLNNKGRNLKPEERKVGYVSQEPTLFPWLSVTENIRFGLGGMKAQVNEAWIDELTEKLTVMHLLSRRPAELSGGETQRVALARALAPRPSMLLLDEPLSAIDVELRPAIRSYLRELQAKWQIPVIMVSHDKAEIHNMADRVFSIKDGSIIETRQRGRITQSPLISY